MRLIPSGASLCALLFTVSASLAADKADVAGTWKWSTQTRDGQTRESSLVLKQEAGKVTGTLQGPRGETAIAEAKVEGNELTFKVTRETQRGTTVASYKGAVDGDAIKGKITTRMGDRENERDWTAKREPIDPSGAWAWIMKREDGDPWEATLQLKREGDQVTGYFQREDSDWRLEIRNAKLAGKTLSFETVMERDGQSTTIKNSAVIEGKAMKGKSEGSREGEPWVRTWEATKK